MQTIFSLKLDVIEDTHFKNCITFRNCIHCENQALYYFNLKIWAIFEFANGKAAVDRKRNSRWY